MKKVLIITYYWPPAGGPGVQRWLKFVKYMREFGWEPVVLTVKDGTYPALDHSLESDIPEGVTVYKTKPGGPFKIYNLLKRKKEKSVSVALINLNERKSLFDRLSLYIRSNYFIPDARKGWKRHALKRVPGIIKEHSPAVIVTSGPPHSTHLIGLKIKKMFGLPWVADFRDPWTTVYYNTLMPRTTATKRKDRSLEDRVLGAADLVVTVGYGMKREFDDRAQRIEVIFNGYDIDDMPSQIEPLENSYFELLHTGNLAPNQHVPELIDAFAELCQTNPDFKNDFRLRFVGNTDGSVLRYIENAGISENVICEGYVAHNAATRMMADAAMLLLVIPQSDGNRSILTGKLFEYLASGTPILAIGPVDGDAASILTDTGRGQMLDFRDKTAMKNLINNQYRNWLEAGRKSMPLSKVRCEKYSRREGTKKLSGLLDEMMTGSGVNL